MTIRWGILGTALIAEKVAAAIRQVPGCELAAIASRSEDRAQQWAERHGVGRACGSYDALLADPAIDAVYIPLPPSMHAEWTLRAAEAGKHILCEKPFACDSSEAQAMIAETKRQGVRLMDGVMWVHHDRTRRMKERLEAGALGDLRRVTAAFSFAWDAVPADNIRVQKELGGGCLGDLGYYCLRAIWWTFGELPERVFATARYRNDVEMNLSAMLWFSGQRMASFDCGFDTVMRQWFEIAGSTGSLVCDDFVLPKSNEKARFWNHDAAGAARELSVLDCVQEVRMIEHFAAAIGAGEDPGFTDDALATMRMVDMVARSARESRIIERAS